MKQAREVVDKDHFTINWPIWNSDSDSSDSKLSAKPQHSHFPAWMDPNVEHRSGVSGLRRALLT